MGTSAANSRGVSMPLRRSACSSNVDEIGGLMKGRAFLSSFLALLILSASVAAQNFNNPVRIPTIQDPYSVFAVDLNGDGLPDLLYGIPGINSTPSTMQTFLAQAGGGYAAGPTLTLPLNVAACRPADVNNDGKQDLVCIDYIDICDSQIAVFLGNGDGTFQGAIYSGEMHSNCLVDNFFPELFAPADLNSDGYPDLAVGDTFNFEFFVLLGDGAGHFTVSATVLSNGVDGGVLMAADLNGDGKPDLVSSLGPLVYLGNGNGAFGSEMGYGTFDSCNYHDMEGDGHLDAVCVTDVIQGADTYTGTNQLAILHGNADGSFNTTPIASQTFGNPEGGAAAIQSPTAILDVNGDGIPDILGASEDGLSVLLGQANLQFSAPVHYAVSNFGVVGSTTNQVVDLNGDGYPDIVSTGSSGLYISYGNGNGTFKAPPAYQVANELGWMTVADFNGDGIPDIAATGDQSIELSLGKADGTFQPFEALPNGGITFAGGSLIAHGDFRGTGNQDILAVGSANGQLGTSGEYGSYLLFNNGNGTFSSPQQLTSPNIVFTSLGGLAIADFNGDGRDDFLTTIPGPDPPAVEVGLSNGDGTFNTATTVLPNVGTGYVPFPAVADFNKDGKPDLVYVAGANANVLLGNGDGSFNTNAVVLPIPPYQGQSEYYQPLAVATGDFDGDGNPDFAVLALVGPWSPPPSPYIDIATAVYVFYGNGDGTFSAPVIAASSTAVYDTIYTADVTNDGLTDLILATTGTEATGLASPGNSVGVFLSEPGRLFGPESDYEVGERSSAVFVANVNGDGYPNLLISNSSYWGGGYTPTLSNSVTELSNLGPATNSGLLASNTILAASSNSFVAGTSVTFTATVSGASSSGDTPTGSVRFADQTGIQTVVPLVAAAAGSATATFTTSEIPPGTDTMSAAYLGNGTFATSFATVALTSTGLPDVVELTATPTQFDTGFGAMLSVTVANPAGSTAATPTGYIEFYDGSTILGGPNTLSNGSTTFGSSLSLGLNTLTARYSGDLIHTPGSASIVDDVQATPTILLNPPATQATTAQATTFTIAVNGGNGNPTPTGSVVLAGGGFTSTPSALQTGSASITVPAGALPVGNYTLTATYTPDSASTTLYLSASGTASFDVVTAPPGFTVTGTALTITPGATTGNTSTITLSPAGGFTGNVALSAAVTSGPAAAQYPPTFSFGSTSPVAITGTGGATATLTVTTTAPSNSAYLRPTGGNLRWCGISGASLALMLLFGIRRRHIRWGAALRMGLLLVAIGCSSLGCGGNSGSGGGGGSGAPGTTAGTYTVTITGTSGTISATNTITLIVQ
jgi:Bacterial Ig-like domain (group 3)/FG-GAP-like repeat